MLPAGLLSTVSLYALSILSFRVIVLLCLTVCVLVYINFFEALGNFLKTIFVCVGKASSFAIFGLCVGLCELQMCLPLGLA
jgi:hypothetical protein